MRGLHLFEFLVPLPVFYRVNASLERVDPLMLQNVLLENRVETSLERVDPLMLQNLLQENRVDPLLSKCQPPYLCQIVFST
ncbi:hypothetical protein HYC85_028610 [Camellia sinensis]|uniref:Uncharacterized protein n=1 Tax=Camellia sinensis TaxID=4442 RepID=A0A7J7FVW5_CAMSI|nr:hypothetical protein HYC85_028610 [Camellia sinensis]